MRLRKAAVNPKSHKGVDWNDHLCYSDESERAVWMDNSLTLAFNLRRMRNLKEEASGVWLLFHDGGDCSALDVWVGDPAGPPSQMRCMGQLQGEELALFLTRSLGRVLDRTASGPRALPARTSRGFTIIQGGRKGDR